MSLALVTDQPAETARIDLMPMLLDIGRRARAAQRAVGLATAEQKSAALRAMAAAIRAAKDDILLANATDLVAANRRGQTAAFIDRLTLTEAGVESIAQSVEDIAALPDPVGRVLATFSRPNGLVIERVATPLGVIGVIFESRPNVTADAGALCLKAGNATILRAGSDSFESAMAIRAAMAAGLRAAGLPEDAIQLVPTRDRAAVGAMLMGPEGTSDVPVPRGGKSLVARVQNEARIPVFAHLEGIVHIFVDRAADLEMAKTIVLNSKMRRTGICGAAETLLIDKASAATHLAPLVKLLLDAACAVRGDTQTLGVDPLVIPATDADWRTEYLDAIVAVRVVDGLDGAIEHIETYGSHHTDCIITEDKTAAERFLNEVDSAIVLHNASTQFADGGEFGIATGRMHARGPVGIEQLTAFKYRVRGNGQVRA